MHRPATITLRVSSLTSRLRRTGMRPGRRPLAALAAVGVGTALALGACSTQSPAQTTVEYQPGDGIDVNLGAVQARGLVLVSAAKGAAGVLIGSLINSGSDPVTVTFLTAEQAQGSTSTGPTMQLKGNVQQPISGVQIPNVPVAPGDLTNIVLQTKAGQVFANVPVLLPDGYYSSYTPTAVPTTATATTASRDRDRHGTTATSGATTATTPPALRRPAADPHTRKGYAGAAQAASNLYPSPRTVTMCRGLAGSGSILARSRLTCTSSVLVSPT